MRKEFNIKNELEMIKLGFKIGELLDKNMVITLSGDLGAGKTTLTKGIGKALEIPSIINSPTFTILKIHFGRLPLYHMDTYRINKETKDDDLEEFFERDGVCVVEWAENIEYLLPSEYLKIDISINNDSSRNVVLESIGSRYEKIIESV